jgi:type II secretory pathway pseudopilin PulG
MKTQLKDDQRGLAVIVIVATLVVVITLIVMGFSTIARREQRQALDQQLAQQARYAAESAINDVIANFRANPAGFVEMEDCGDPRQTFVDGQEIQTTCVLAYSAPGPLEYDEVPLDTPTLVWLDPGATNVDRLFLTWDIPGKDPGVCLASGYNVLPQSLSGNQIGMLRFDLWSAGTGTFTREGLTDSQFGGVLYPRSDGVAQMPYTTGAINQPVIFGTCGGGHQPSPGATPYTASATIDLPNNNHRYILRVQSVYRTSKLKVVGYEVATGNHVLFRDAQLVVEATARVGDVAQRVQVRIPASTPPRELLSEHAIHVTSQGICKLLQTEPNSVALGC